MNLFKLLFFGTAVIAVSALTCWSQVDKIGISTEKVKELLMSDDSAPDALVSQTNEANRADTVSVLKDILGQELRAKDSYKPRLAMAAMSALAIVNHNTNFATLRPFLYYPNLKVQGLAAKYIGQSRDPLAIDILTAKLKDSEARLPEKSAFNAQTENHYRSILGLYLNILVAIDGMSTPETNKIRDGSLARFEAKYQGTPLEDAFLSSFKEEKEQNKSSAGYSK